MHRGTNALESLIAGRKYLHLDNEPGLAGRWNKGENKKARH